MKPPLHKTCIAAALALLVGLVAHAQRTMYVQPLGVQQGLSQSSVMALHQDNLGFVWAGTRDGLNEYTASGIRIYKTVPGDSLSIASNQINDIANADGNNLWIAHSKGISYFERDKGVFINYTPESGENPNVEIRSVTVVNGEVWACGWSGTYVWDEATRSFVHPQDNPVHDEIMRYAATKIMQDARGRYWLATTSRGLYWYQERTRQLSNPLNTEGWQLPPDLRIEDMLFHPNGTIYLATYGHGLIACDTAGRILQNWHSRHPDPRYRLRGNNLRCLAIDKSGLIWVGGFQGLNTVQPQTGIAEHVAILKPLDILPDFSVRSLMTDTNGSLWAGTFHNGIFIHDAYLERFRFIPVASAPGLNSSRDIVSAMVMEPARHLYVATEDGRVKKYSSDYKLLQTWNMGTAEGEEGPVIKSMYYDSLRACLWIGTLRSGLYKLQITTGTISKVQARVPGQLVEGLAALGVINAMAAADSGHIWLLTDKLGGLHRFNPATAQLQTFANQETLRQAVGKASVKHIAPAGNRRWLISTQGGGLLYFEMVPRGMVKKVLATPADINHVLPAQDGSYIVSTSGSGIIFLDSQLRQVKQYTNLNGLLNNTVWSAAEAPRNKFWIFTFTGLSLYTGNPQEAFVNYHINNGFPLTEINAGATLASSGTPPQLFAGGKSGWVPFSPATLQNNPYPPGIYITQVQVPARSFSIHPYLGAASADNPLELKYNETTLNVELAGLNYLLPQNNRFRYKVAGLDDDWKYTDSKGQVTLTRLPAGKYTFVAQAANNDGVWSTAQASFHFTVLPAPWRTPLAFVGYGLFFIGGILVIRHNAIRSTRLRHNLKLKEMEQQRQEEQHALKIKHFTDISHEIRTPLTLIMSPTEELMEHPELPEDVQQKLATIHYHSRSLLLLVNQLLEIRRVELKKEQLDPAPVWLPTLVAQVTGGFSSLADQGGIRWQVQLSDVATPALALDADKLEKILLNLVSNAFKFTPSGGMVSLQLATQQQPNGLHKLTIVVSDTGAGIAEEDLPHIFDRFFKGDATVAAGSGIGLSLVKAIVEDLMKGSIEVQSQPGKGSTFTLHIPDLPAADASEVQQVATVKEVPPEFTMRTPLWQDEQLPEDGEPRQTIMVVEDNPELLAFLVEKFNRHFKVLHSSTAEQALALLAEHAVDLIVTDIMLPDMDGVAFCAQVKSDMNSSHIPVLMLTAMQDSLVRIKSLELGADDFLTKPFSYKELYLRVKNILERRRQWQEYLQRKGWPTAADAPPVKLNRYDEELLHKIDTQIEKHLDEPEYTIEQLGKEIGMSRVHLYRKIKALTGLSPTLYIRNYRIRKAADILTQEDVRISEVAYRVGFQDLNYFSKCFKAVYGIAPTQYGK